MSSKTTMRAFRLAGIAGLLSLLAAGPAAAQSAPSPGPPPPPAATPAADTPADSPPPDPGAAVQDQPADGPPDSIAAPFDRAAKPDRAIANQRQLYGPPEPAPEEPIRCTKERRQSPDEIVVCARLEDQGRYRIPSSHDRGDDSKLAWDGRAPDLEPHYPGPVVARGCFIPPCPKPPTYYFDITALPEPPAGSDADKIAKGEIPAPH